MFLNWSEITIRSHGLPVLMDSGRLTNQQWPVLNFRCPKQTGSASKLANAASKRNGR